MRRERTLQLNVSFMDDDADPIKATTIARAAARGIGRDHHDIVSDVAIVYDSFGDPNHP